MKARARARGGAGAWVAACCEGLASGAWWAHRVVGIDLALAKHVQVLEQDGDMSGPAIMGASLALADAGIEMFDLVAACSVARAPVPAGNAGLLLDPSSAQLAGAAAGGTLTVAMMPARGEVTQISQVGEWDMEQYMEAMELGLEACGQLHTLMRQALVSSVQASS